MGAEKGSAFLLKVGNGAEPPVFAKRIAAALRQPRWRGGPRVRFLVSEPGGG